MTTTFAHPLLVATEMAALPGRPQHRHRPRRRVGAGERRSRPRPRDRAAFRGTVPSSQGSPWVSWWPCPMPCSSAVALRRGRYTGLVGIAVGTAMVAWILVELAFIRELSFFHPLYVAVGLLMVWAGFRVVRVDLGVPAASLAQELRDALADVPRFLAAPLIRRRHLRWGATDDEVAATLPGDDRIPSPTTSPLVPSRSPLRRNVSGRGSSRSDADVRGSTATTCSTTAPCPAPRRSTTSCSSWTSGSGSRWPNASPRARRSGSPRCRAPHELLWRKPDSTWAWRLTPTDTGGTRLVTRIRADA